MKDLLDFISNNLGWLFVFGLFFGGSIYSFLDRIAKRWHERLLRQSTMEARLKILQEQRRIAEVTGDAIKLLVVDTALGAEFEGRLHAALEVETALKPGHEEDLEVMEAAGTAATGTGVRVK